MLALFISLQDKQEDLTSGQAAAARAGPDPPSTCRIPARLIVVAAAGAASPLLTSLAWRCSQRPALKGEFQHKSRVQWTLLPRAPARTSRARLPWWGRRRWPLRAAAGVWQLHGVCRVLPHGGERGWRVGDKGQGTGDRATTPIIHIDNLGTITDTDTITYRYK